MTDFASIGIKLDSTPVVDGVKALDALAESSARVEQRVKTSNGQMADTSRIMAAQAEQTRNAAAGNAALGASTNQLTIGQQLLIERFREQAATIGMSRSQLMAYQAAQMGLTTETAKAIATVKAHEDAIRAAAKAKEDAAKSASQLTDVLKLLAAGYALLKVTDYIKDSALLAARYETLGVVMEVVGRNAGYTKTQMDAASEGIARQGITMVESREAAVKLVQAHVDLRYAETLARGAQDAAVIGHVNSSEAFDRMVNGIARGNVLILRNLGINVNLQTAYRQMAEELGKSTKELTENERVQARTAAVLERLTDIHGTYTAAMDTAGKQILSMQRYTQDFKTTFGETFNEALTIGVMALTDHLKNSNKSITELSKNNQLEEWGHNLTNIFVTLANTVSNAYTSVQKFDTFARSMDARKAINTDFDAQSKQNFSDGGITDLAGVYARGKRIEAMRQAALAQENVDYVTHQAELSGNFDRFARSAAEREATRTAKHKAEADARIKVDADYAKAAKDILLKSANEGDAAQAAAGKKVLALYNATYVGTPTYRDTEGREPKDKVDQAENTRMADRLKRIETEANAEKAAAEFMIRIDEMRHKAGEMGDAEFYERRRGYADEIAGAEIASYNKQLAELQKHYSHTKEEAEKNTKVIHDVEDKLAAARTKYAYDDLTRDEEDRSRKDTIINAAVAASTKEIASINAQVDAVEMQIRTYGMLPAAKTAVVIADLEEQAAALAGLDNSQKTIDLINEKIEALKRLRIAQGKSSAQDQGTDIAKARDLLEIMTAVDTAARDAAAGMTASFGAVGTAIGGLTTAMTGYSRAQATVAAQLAADTEKAHGDQAKIQQANALAAVQSAQAQIKSYGDMAGAAKGFFKENTAGYKVMEGAEKAFRAYEMAMAVESMVKKIFFKEGEVAANLALNGTKLTGEAVTTAASTGLAATEASAWGITAVVKAMASLPFPLNLAAGAATLAAVVAIGAKLVGSIGGGGSGGGQSAADVQKAQGTGSVFGDSTAKSDSIARSIALATANSSIELTHTAGMLAALKNIEASMAGLTNLIVRAPGVTDGSNLGIQTGVLSQGPGGFMGSVTSILAQIPLIGGLLSGLSNLWGKTTQNVVDSGLQFGGSVNALQAGQGYQQYASVDTTKSSWFGLSKSTSNSVQTQGLSSELSSQFGLIFTNLEDALKVAAVGLGVGADQVTRALDSLTIDTTKISLKGLTGDALTQAINGVISKTMDQMAQAAFPNLDSFRKVGEGYAETVVRVATDYANLDSILQASGMTFGAVGLSSLAAREKLIELAGGIDSLAGKSTSFAQNFLTQAEQLAPVTKYVNEQMAALGLSSVTTRDQFKNVVLGLNLTTASGQAEYVALMSLADAFAKTHAATVDLSKSTQEIADERKDLQSQLDQLTMTSAQLLMKQRNALDASNRGLFDQIQAAQKLKDAQDAAKTSLGDVISKMKSFGDSAKALHDGLLTGGLSTLTPEQQYAETKRQYESTLALAKGGDTTAQGQYSAMATAFLTASQKVNSGDSQYGADFAGILQTSGDMANWALGQVDVAQASLDALNAQVIGISDLNATMLSVADAVNGLPTAFAAAPTVVMPAPVLNYSTMGTANTEALVAEVKALRASNEALVTEVQGLRADQQRQTGDSIGAVAQVQQDAAQTIVDGVGGAIERAVSAAQKVALE
jgi:hypothetical protein